MLASERRDLNHAERKRLAMDSATPELPDSLVEKARRVLDRHDASDLYDMLFCPPKTA